MIDIPRHKKRNTMRMMALAQQFIGRETAMFMCIACGHRQPNPCGNPNLETSFCLSCKTHNVGFKRMTGIHPHTVRAVLQGFARFLTSELQQGRRVQMKELGTFMLRRRKGRVTMAYPRGRKPGQRGFSRSSEFMVEREHPEADYVNFVPSPTLKKAIWQVRKPVYKSQLP